MTRERRGLGQSRGLHPGNFRDVPDQFSQYGDLTCIAVNLLLRFDHELQYAVGIYLQVVRPQIVQRPQKEPRRHQHHQ